MEDKNNMQQLNGVYTGILVGGMFFLLGMLGGVLGNFVSDALSEGEYFWIKFIIIVILLSFAVIIWDFIEKTLDYIAKKLGFEKEKSVGFWEEVKDFSKPIWKSKKRIAGILIVSVALASVI